MARKNFTTTLDEDILKEARKICLDIDKNVNEIIELKLLEFIKNHKSQKESE